MKRQWGIAVAWGIFLLGSCAIMPAQADPEAARLRNELGIIYVKDGHLEDGLRNFSLILAEFPEQAAALNNAANVYFLQGDTERARGLYERAVEAAPSVGGVHLNLGILLHTIGEREASAASVRKGLELVGDVQHAYFLLGLSDQSSDPNRASDGGGLGEAEIEQLLAQAMADVPNEDPAATATSGENVELTSTETEQRMETRPGGAKASEAGVESERLFWMELESRR